MEQPVFASNDEGFDRESRKIVIDIESAITKIGIELANSPCTKTSLTYFREWGVTIFIA
jgi:hypothetical protein